MADLVQAVIGGDLDNSRAKDVFQRMLESGDSAANAMQALGIEKVDSSEMEELCKELLAANPRVVQDVKEGKQKAIGALIGQAKKKNPNANPGQIRELCLKLIDAM